MRLCVSELRRANMMRVGRFGHGGLDNWTPGQWATALAGEVGEVCNEIKKLWRGDGSVDALGAELADVVIYADLLAARYSIVEGDLHPGSPYWFDRTGVASANNVTGDCFMIGDVLRSTWILLVAFNRYDPDAQKHLAELLMLVNSMACRYRVPLASAIVAKFNATSGRIGAPERLVGEVDALQRIVTATCRMLGVEHAELGDATRRPAVVLAREIISRMGRQYSECSFPAIAEAIGLSSHATIVAAARRMGERLAGGSEQMLDLGGEAVSIATLYRRVEVEAGLGAPLATKRS